MINIITEEEKKMLKEVVSYNHRLVNSVDGDIDKVIDDLIIINHNDNSIWNPLMDISMRFEVDPVDEYGEEKIKAFINDYKNKML